MVLVTGQNRERAVAAGLLAVLFALTAALASVTPGRSSEPSQAADTVVPATVLATARRCTAGDLALTFGSEAAGVMRQSAAYFGLENTARSACTLQGYPGVDFFDGAGRRIDAQVRTGGGYIIQDPGSTPVTLAPGATGWFGLNWVVENVRAGNLTGCIEPASIGVTPPGSVRQLRLLVRLQAPPCLVSGFSVTALAAGSQFNGAFRAPTPGN